MQENDSRKFVDRILLLIILTFINTLMCAFLLQGGFFLIILSIILVLLNLMVLFLSLLRSFKNLFSRTSKTRAIIKFLFTFIVFASYCWFLLVVYIFSSVVIGILT